MRLKQVTYRSFSNVQRNLLSGGNDTGALPAEVCLVS